MLYYSVFNLHAYGVYTWLQQRDFATFSIFANIYPIL